MGCLGVIIFTPNSSMISTGLFLAFGLVLALIFVFDLGFNLDFDVAFVAVKFELAIVGVFLQVTGRVNIECIAKLRLILSVNPEGETGMH